MWFLTLIYTLHRLLWAHTLFVLRASVEDDNTYGTYKTYGTYGTNKAGLADWPVYRMANHPTGCLPTTPPLPITPIFHI